jgi:Tfp pilus assembly protein PilZ
VGIGETEAGTRLITVHFPTGRELLGAYWGLLAHGGLVLDEPLEVSEGERVELEVTLGSVPELFRLHGKVVRTPHTPETQERVVIAFEPGEPHDLLLDAAWAESEHTAARRERRFELDVDIRFHAPTAGELETAGRLINVSLGGCCLRLRRPHRLKVGEPLTLITQRSRLTGVVRWSEGSCRGIEFQAGDHSAVERFVKQFL